MNFPMDASVAEYLRLLFIAEQFTAWRAEPVFICSVIPEHMCPTLD